MHPSAISSTLTKALKKSEITNSYSGDYISTKHLTHVEILCTFAGTLNISQDYSTL